MTPIGHLATAYLAARPVKRIPWPALVIGSAAPDLDWLLFPLPVFNEVHRLVTHNLLFVFTMGLVGAVVTLRGRWRWVLVALILGGLLHLAIDSCFDTNPSNGIGIALFWPLSNVSYSLINLARPVSTTVGWAEPEQLIGPTLRSIGYEIPFVLVVAWMLWRDRVRQVGTRADSGRA